MKRRGTRSIFSPAAERRVIDKDMALALLGRTIPAVTGISPPALLSALARETWGAGQQP